MIDSKTLDLYDGKFERIRNKYKLEECDTIFSQTPEKVIENFILYSDYKDNYFHNFFKIPTACPDHFYLGSIAVVYAMRTGKYQSTLTDLQLIIIKELNSNYGRILIRPETFQDKINEFFNRSEIDFVDYPKFSSRYFYLSQDKNLALKFATDSRLNLIADQNEIFIEVRDNILIAKYSRNVTYDDCMALLEFGKKV